MINIQELSLLRDYKYMHLSDKISKGEANLDGNWIRYYDSFYHQEVNFDNYILKVGTTVFGDDNIIYQKDGTLFISERAKDMFKSNGDIVGYLFDIENRWRELKKKGDRELPYKKWCKELNQFVLFVMFCIIVIVGGTKTLITGLYLSIIIGIVVWIIGHFLLYQRNKQYIKEYISVHKYDDYSKILINDYLSEDNTKLFTNDIFKI